VTPRYGPTPDFHGRHHVLGQHLRVIELSSIRRDAAHGTSSPKTIPTRCRAGGEGRRAASGTISLAGRTLANGVVAMVFPRGAETDLSHRAFQNARCSRQIEMALARRWMPVTPPSACRRPMSSGLAAGQIIRADCM